MCSGQGNLISSWYLFTPTESLEVTFFQLRVPFQRAHTIRLTISFKIRDKGCYFQVCSDPTVKFAPDYVVII